MLAAVCAWRPRRLPCLSRRTIQGRMLRIIRWTAVGLVSVVLAGSAVLWLRPGGPGGVVRSAAGIATPGGVQVGGPFTLVDQTGRTVTEATWRGRWMLIYFGYTTCPDVCPTELQTIAAALDALGRQAAQVVPIFITIDPERDTPGQMAEYVKLFDDRLIGLSGTAEQIAAVARAYRVYYAKVAAKESVPYLMDHSSLLYLMGPDGTLRTLFRPGTSAQDMADAIRSRLLAAS
jgi:protein SCO1/2